MGNDKERKLNKYDFKSAENYVFPFYPPGLEEAVDKAIAENNKSHLLFYAQSIERDIVQLQIDWETLKEDPNNDWSAELPKYRKTIEDLNKIRIKASQAISK